MENAPSIVLFWLFMLADLALLVAAVVGCLVFFKRAKQRRLWGGICLAAGILCAIPLALVVGYVLYLYLG